MASSGRLKPGEKGKITAKVDIKGRVGPITKNIQVFTNDPKKHIISLFLKATVK